MTDVTGAQSKIQIEESQYRSSISEAFAQKVGANINYGIDTYAAQVDVATNASDIDDLEAYHTFNNTYFGLSSAGSSNSGTAASIGAIVLTEQTLATIVNPSSGLYMLSGARSSSYTTDSASQVPYQFYATLTGGPLSSCSVVATIEFGSSISIVSSNSYTTPFGLAFALSIPDNTLFNVSGTGSMALKLKIIITNTGSVGSVSGTIGTPNTGWLFQRV